MKRKIKKNLNTSKNIAFTTTTDIFFTKNYKQFPPLKKTYHQNKKDYKETQTLFYFN